MKKLLIMTLTIALLANSASIQADDSSYILKARNAIGAEFNATVKAIKTYLKSSDENIKVDKNDIDTAKSEIINLKSASIDDENNPTVLDHGDANLPSCTSSVSGYSNESSCRDVHDLVWDGSKWDWKKPSPKADCTPSSGEVKISDGKGGYTCKQNGTYTSTTDGYGPCVEPIGLKYTQSVCMFKNNLTNKTYQVDASNCGTAAAQTSKVCGYDWKIISYNTCRSGDVQDANYQCQERATNNPASNSKCLTSRPSSTKSCIFYTYSWATSAYGSCQSDSKQYRTSICKQSPGNATVADANCGTKPSLNRACSYYTGSWVMGSYGSCSVSGACGQTGVRTATYSCQGGPCSGSKPASRTTSCSTAACPTGSWVMGSYSSCSVSGACGQTGTRTATYSCQGGTCSTSRPSNSVISCSTAACPTGSWVMGSYSSCSVSGACGQTGTRTATYSCQGGTCSTSRPSNSVISCSTVACPIYTYAWSYGSYGTCNSSSRQYRTVTCKRNPGYTSVSDFNCGTKPATSRSCTYYTGSWVRGSYGSCSVSACGQTGTKSASYSCQGGPCAGSKPSNAVTSCSTPACATCTEGARKTIVRSCCSVDRAGYGCDYRDRTLTATCRSGTWTSTCPTPSRGCFIKGTQISMFDGTLINVEDVKVGDVLLAENNTSNKVVKLKPLYHKGLRYSINGSKYFVTESHPFMTTQGWKAFNASLAMEINPTLEIGTLKTGDTLITEDETILIKGFDSKYDESMVYNFELDGTRVYYADGYLVHNK